MDAFSGSGGFYCDPYDQDFKDFSRQLAAIGACMRYAALSTRTLHTHIPHPTSHIHIPHPISLSLETFLVSTLASRTHSRLVLCAVCWCWGQTGLKIKDMRGDGNCLFRALADQLNGDADGQHTSTLAWRCTTVYWPSAPQYGCTTVYCATTPVRFTADLLGVRIAPPRL